MDSSGYSSRRLARAPGGAFAAVHEFVRVYDEHVWHVYGFLAYRLRDDTEAEDLTQATFERALKAWSRFDSRKGSERTWLLTIARNLLADHHRRDDTWRQAGLNEATPPTVAGPEARDAIEPALARALRQLSDRDREVLALRFGADLTGPEVADMLGLSLANVQQIASRSLRQLRELLDRDVQGAALRREQR